LAFPDFEQRLLELLRRRPFQPFQIELENGEHLVVGEPRALMYRGGASAMYFGIDDIRFFGFEAVRRIIELVPASA
jgi:hypothetical protein